jgi:flagellar assembly protein FliH
MSIRARRIDASRATAFAWSSPALAKPAVPPTSQSPLQVEPGGAAATAAADLGAEAAERAARLAALERDAFVKGYAQGEKAGAEAGIKRTDAVLRRLGETIDELAGLRRHILQHSEQQLVQLALALARRVVRREIASDDELLGALARVALERLGEARPATIRLNPDDFARSAAGRVEQWAAAHVTVIPDPHVHRGGCLVESPFGFVDTSIDAQLQELAGALLEVSYPGLEDGAHVFDA